MNTGYCEHSFDRFVSEKPDFSFGGLEYTTDKSRWYPDKFSINNCHADYKPGWIGHCSDCDEDISILFYVSPDTISQIRRLPVGTYYYYTCPECCGLEQGVQIMHECNLVSYNRYAVQYISNPPAGRQAAGHMPDSYHMYDNATEYDGVHVDPVRNLTHNAYSVIGYEFTGWNTKPDGTGTGYTDKQEILNLTTENYNPHVPGQGVVKLYAQWSPSQSTLVINPNGGSYNGNKSNTVVTKGYGESYVANGQIIAPDGFLVSFDCRGGNPVSPIRQKMRFDRWDEAVDDGRFIATTNTYIFYGTSGSTDYITAQYAGLEVELPTPIWEGHLFAGWYYDTEYKVPAGPGGTKIIPGSDTTLYACWEDLKLESVNNWTANSGKGAVDLSWTLKNNATMVYKLYQSAAGSSGPWTQISTATDVADASSINKSFTGQGTWTVPYTGLYTINAKGAKGGNYGSYNGGKGGTVKADIWLTEGEILTYDVGGGAGTGSAYGNGGGYSRLISNLQGELLTAGGGGGATVLEEGKPGGVVGATVSGPSGESGMAGGGGGHDGGAAGEAVLHHHKPECLFHEDHVATPTQAVLDATTASSGGSVYSTTKETGYGVGDLAYFYYGGLLSDNDNTTHSLTTGSFDVPGTGKLSFDVASWLWGNLDAWPMSLSITDQSGRQLYSRSFDTGFGELYGYPDLQKTERSLSCGCTRPVFRVNISGDGISEGNYNTSYTSHDGSTNINMGVSVAQAKYGYYWSDDMYCNQHEQGDFGGGGTCAVHVELDIPESVTSIKINARFKPRQNGSRPCHTNLAIENIKYTYTEEYYTCGYEEGDVESSMGANGGTNWCINFAYNIDMQAGVNGSSASMTISSDAVGFHTGMSLPGVNAPDTAAPNIVDAGRASFKDAGRLKVGVSWEDPGDNSTPYWHKCEAYTVPNMVAPALTSNITLNTLTSGVVGYRYVIDTSSGTQVGASGTYTGSPYAEVSFPESVYSQTKYLHVAAVDKAGNIGPTAHIRVSTDGVALYWDILTTQIEVSGDNIYAKPGTVHEWYVKADGRTPFALQESVYLNGAASGTYQPNYVGFVSSGIQDLYYRANDTLSDGVLKYDTSGISHSSTGNFALEYLPVSTTSRSSRNTTLSHIQQYFMNASDAGRRIQVIPVAGAQQDKWTTTWSDPVKDAMNGVLLIGDAKGPDYHGLEIFDQMKEGMIDRRDGDIQVDITATDDLSGVKEFFVIIKNEDTDQEHIFKPDPDGHVRITITEDSSLFSGDFTVNVTGYDNVGNESHEEVNTFEFDIQASVERILEPHDPLFQAGESGYLYITTWGYVDYVTVEFPESFTKLNPGLDTTFVYNPEDLSRRPSYREDEKYQFMIPLYAPEGEDFKIKVTAHKGDKAIEKYPEFSVYDVSGTVLDELRTRLR